MMNYIDDIILLTACFRGPNLDIIARSIMEAQELHKSGNVEQLKIYWVICVDTVHWKGDLHYSNVKDELRQRYPDLDINFYERVPTGEVSMGSDLYNEPLMDFMSKHKFINPWIYILDDDNILHPNLLSYVSKVTIYNPDKEIIWLTNMQRSGRIDGVISEDYAMQVTKSGSFFMNFPDPSTLVYRYSLLEKYGLYQSNKSNYDLVTFVPMIGENLDKCIFADELDPKMPHPSVQVVHAYHDGLRTEDEFEADMQSFEVGTVNSCNFRVQTDEARFPTQYHIPPELGEMILHMIKVYYDQHNMTGHISRGSGYAR